MNSASDLYPSHAPLRGKLPCLASMQRSACRVVCNDGRQLGCFAELITEPGPKLCIFDLLKGKPNRLAENLSDALLGGALGAMVRDSSAELCKDGLKTPLGFSVDQFATVTLLTSRTA